MANWDIILSNIVDILNYTKDKTLYECEKEIRFAHSELKKVIYESKSKEFIQTTRHLFLVKTKKKILLSKRNLYPEKVHPLFDSIIADLSIIEKNLRNERNKH